MIKKTLYFLIRFPLVKKLHMTLLKWASSYGILARIWYLFSGAFQREQQAVLTGIYSHKSGLKTREREGGLYTLRRNTHRLEKGLIMQPRRSVFALDYIEATVALYVSLSSKMTEDHRNADTLKWARDVLRTYFDVVDDNNTIIGQAKSHFATSSFGVEVDNPEASVRRPYKRDLDVELGITIDHLFELAKRRRSCRWFLDKRVPRELIDRALTVGTYAPSACNRQPFEFRIFDDPTDAVRIGAIPGGTTGFSHNFPCITVLIGDLAAYPAERDRHVPYIDASLAAMGFLFGLEVQGLSSCCINWPDIEEREVKMANALELKANQRVIMLIAIGYPDSEQMVPYSQKKPLDEIRGYHKNAN